MGRASPSVRTSDADNSACSCPWLSPKTQILATIGDGDVDEQIGAGICRLESASSSEGRVSRRGGTVIDTVTSVFPHIWGGAEISGEFPNVLDLTMTSVQPQLVVPAGVVWLFPSGFCHYLELVPNHQA